MQTLKMNGPWFILYCWFPGSTAEGGGGSGAIVLQEARMDVLSDQGCTDGWGSDLVPNNLDICVRDDNHGGDTQICLVSHLIFCIIRLHSLSAAKLLQFTLIIGRCNSNQFAIQVANMT